MPHSCQLESYMGQRNFCYCLSAQGCPHGQSAFGRKGYTVATAGRILQLGRDLSQEQDQHEPPAAGWRFLRLCPGRRQFIACLRQGAPVSSVSLCNT